MPTLSSIFDRLPPALLMAASAILIGAGLLSYSPSALGDVQTPSPGVIVADPLFTSPARPVNTSPPAATATPVPLDPTQTASPPAATATVVPLDPTRTASPPIAIEGVASRIRIPSLGIDLPVVPGDLPVPGNVDYYPLCDVAMFLPEYVQPAQAGATYIYGHAQRGMFAPLLKASETDDGAELIDALVEVYTSDDMLHLYEIFVVKRHATDLSLAQAPPGMHILVLQTSEGVSGTIPKLQVAARPLSTVPAGHSEANPLPQPRVCLPS